MSEPVHDAYLHGVNFYKAATLSGDYQLDNPDQRVTSDIVHFSQSLAQLYTAWPPAAKLAAGDLMRDIGLGDCQHLWCRAISSTKEWRKFSHHRISGSVCWLGGQLYVPGQVVNAFASILFHNPHVVSI